MVEIMLEAADKQETKGLTRIAIEDRISPLLPFYALIERIRIHDFHRFGIAPPDPRLTQLMIGGPMKLTARSGCAAVILSFGGSIIKTTGDSRVQLQRPLLNKDGEFFDEQSGKYVMLSDILHAFVSKAPHAVLEFEKLVS